MLHRKIGTSTEDTRDFHPKQPAPRICLHAERLFALNLAEEKEFVDTSNRVRTPVKNIFFIGCGGILSGYLE